MIQRRACLSAMSCATLAAGWGLAVGAEQKDLIKVGQSLPLSGRAATQSKTFVAGTNLALDRINRAGGVSGRQVQLISLDDGLDPARTLANVKSLINEHGVSIVAGVAGSHCVLAIEDLLRTTGVPLLGAVGISDRVRAKTAGAAYYVRAGYGREVERVIEQMVTQGLRTVGIAYSDSPGAESETKKWLADAFVKSAVKVKVVVDLRPDGSSFDAAAQAIADARPDAVFLNAPGGLAARLIGSLNKLGTNPVYFGMSLVPGETTAKALGSRLRSLTISEVMPYPLSRTSREIEEFRAQATAAGVPIDYSSIEGFVMGLVLVEALRRAGPAVSPARVHAGLRSLKGRFCGVDINFAASNSGSRFVELIHVDGSGRVVR